MFNRKRKAENPLVASVNDAVRKVCAWEDACGGKYTVDTDTEVGSDYVSLDIKGVDEVRASDFLALVAQDPHVAAYSCNFAKQTLSLVFEAQRRKVPSVTTPVVPKKQHEDLSKELELVKAHATLEREEDLVTVCECVLAVKSTLSFMRSRQVMFDYTSTPGLILITVRGLTAVDTKLFATFRSLRADFGAEVVLVLSPKPDQCVQINVKKGKATINI